MAPKLRTSVDTTLTRSSSADLCGFSWLLTAPRGRPSTSSIVRRVDSLSGAGIHHIVEKGNSYPLPMWYRIGGSSK